MRTLSAPLIDEEALYDRLRARRRLLGTVESLVKAKETVLSAYSTYKAGDITSLVTVIADEDTATKLRSNYEVLRSGALREEGAQILARSRICCLCGIRDTSELDHFLPKQIFPEFAAYTVNLVPVCGVCNKAKDEHYKADEGGAAFIHAYLDELPSAERFLAATLAFDKAVLPSFHLVCAPGMPEATYRVLSSQFDRFELATTYSEEAIELLSEKFGAIEDYFAEGGSSTVEKYLNREARSIEQRFGLNHWKPVILRAAADSAEFCCGGFKLLAS